MSVYSWGQQQQQQQQQNFKKKKKKMYGGRTVSSSVLCVVLEYICVMIVGILVQCMDGLTLL